MDVTIYEVEPGADPNTRTDRGVRRFAAVPRVGEYVCVDELLIFYEVLSVIHRAVPGLEPDVAMMVKRAPR